MKRKFFITTAIDYVNAPPHLGHALEKVQADVIARYQRLLGKDVWFLTGTDEHGAKISKTAQAFGKEPKDFVDGMVVKFQELKKILNISNDDFIRTTDRKRHWPAVAKVWERLKKNGDIYKKKYKGLYCVGCEAFITKKDLVDGKCVLHQKEPERVEEENYFFRLSKYENKIKEIIEKDKIKIIPESKKNEILNFIEKGLEDVSFSRPRKDLQWGIPVPKDDSQTIYVWADALTNYISAIGYEKETKKFKKFWPADVHCIGKDIIKFHAIYWLAMLLSLNLPLPKLIFIHGFITVEGRKMSKSLGNVIDVFQLVEKYGTDAVRYYLLKEIPPTDDGDFSYEKFEQRYNGELACGLGNLLARFCGLAKGKVIKPKAQRETQQKIKSIKANYKKAIESFKFNEALAQVCQLIEYANNYITKEKLWQSQNLKLLEYLSYLLHQMVELLEPFLPDTSNKIKKILITGKKEILFPRINC